MNNLSPNMDEILADLDCSLDQLSHAVRELERCGLTADPHTRNLIALRDLFCAELAELEDKIM